MRVTLTEEYYKTYRRTHDLFHTEQRHGTIGEYVHLLRHGENTSLVVTEQGSPEILTALISVPGLCQYRQHLDGMQSVVSEFFVAGAGQSAHLHFDWDHRHVFLYQVFGQKRVSLISPTMGHLLRPLVNMSQLDLEDMAEPKRLELLRNLNAYDAVLNPGETIYIPALMWHHLDYLDTAMSLGLRFGRTKYGRLFHELFHPNRQLQLFAWSALDQEVLTGKARETYSRILLEYSTSSESGVALYERMQRVFEDACQEHNLESADGHQPDERASLDEQIRKGIVHGLFYGNA